MIHDFFSLTLEGWLRYLIVVVVIGIVWPYFQKDRFSQSLKTHPWHEAGLSLLVVPMYYILSPYIKLTRTRWHFPRAVVWTYDLVGNNVYVWIAYHVLWLIFMIAFVDLGFYWCHRLIHSRRLYSFVHLTHHRFTEPSAFAVYSTSWSEALLLSLPTAVLPLMLVPASTSAKAAYAVVHVAWGSFLHSGYDARGWSRHPILRYVYSPSHHLTHHRRFSGNYGLYFTFWDKLMGTERLEE